MYTVIAQILTQGANIQHLRLDRILRDKDPEKAMSSLVPRGGNAPEGGVAAAVRRQVLPDLLGPPCSCMKIYVVQLLDMPVSELPYPKQATVEPLTI